MLKEKQIDEILIDIGAKLKYANRNNTLLKSDNYKGESYTKADWCHGYGKAVEFAEEVCVHAELGKFPEKLMVAKAPNETPEELEYRRAVFESITVPYWHRAENSLNRVWAEQNYKIDFGDEDATKYYTKEYPIYGSIISYFQSVVTKQKIRDPNSVLCLDFDLPVKDNGQGELVPDQSVQLEPYATIYDADDVLMFEIDDIALFMSKEKSTVKVGGKDERKGYVLYLYDDTNIYRIEQVGEFTDYTFEQSIYYAHNYGKLPAWKLRGIPYEVYSDNPVYQSYFIGALPYLNKALKNDSTLDASINKIAYPTRVYYQSKCNAAGCNDGLVYSPDKDPQKCKSCGGSGVMRFSPLRDFIQTPPANATEDTGTPLPFPALTYVNPDTAILAFTKEKIEQDIVNGFAFINIDVTNEAQSNGTEATATEVRINRDEFYSFLLTISNELFNLLENFVNAANKVRYQQEITISVSPPKTFELVTAQELTAELATVGLPKIAVQQLTHDFLTSRFSQNGQIYKQWKLIENIDPYAFSTVTELLALKSAGVIPLWQFILHNEIKNYIDNALLANPNYLEKKIEEIRKELETKAQEKAALMTARTSADAILNDMATGGAA